MTQTAEFTSFLIFCLCVTFNSPADSLAHGSPVHSQVLAENNQLRKEADDLGPRAELEYWKKRLSKFNYLLDQLKSPDVKAVLAVLAAAKSKLLKVAFCSMKWEWKFFMHMS